MISISITSFTRSARKAEAGGVQRKNPGVFRCDDKGMQNLPLNAFIILLYASLRIWIFR